MDNDELNEIIDKYEEDGYIDGELEGALLTLNERIDNCSSTSIFLGTYLFGFSLSLCLYLGFFDYLFGIDFSELKNWFIYIIIIINSHFIIEIYTDILEKRAYQESREELITLTNLSKYSKNELISLIQEVDSMKDVCKYIKRDKNFK